MDRFDVCEGCGHHRGEHNSDGACMCDVLETRVLGPSFWVKCSCTNWDESDA